METQTNPEDRKAMRREQMADLAYLLVIAVLLAGTVAAAIALIRGEPDSHVRLVLSFAPVIFSLIGAYVWGMRIKRFDERQKKLTYRAVAYGALGVCGMFTGAAAAWGLHQGDNDGLIVIAFCALPLLLLWAAICNAFLLKNWK